MIFGIKEKYHFDPYDVFLAIATNILQRLMTGFMAQSHVCHLKAGARLFCSSAAGVWVWCRRGWSGVWSSALLSVSSASVHLSESQHTPALTSAHPAPAPAASSTGVCLCTFTCCVMYAKQGLISHRQKTDLKTCIYEIGLMSCKWPHKYV